MSPCPEKLHLYSYMDGEVSRDERLAIDAHVRACSSCRDELRSLSAVQGNLFRRPAVHFAADFEDRFLAELHGRMVTSEEVGRYRRAAAWRIAGPIAAAVLGVVMVAVWMRSNEGGTASPGDADGAYAAARAEETRVARLAALRDELGRRTTDLETAMKVSPRELLVLDRRFNRDRGRLARELTALLGQRDEDADRAVLHWMALHGDHSYVSDLRVYLQSEKRSRDTRRAVLNTAARIGTPESCRLLSREIRDGFPLRHGLRLLLEVNTEESWNEVEDIARRRPEADAAEIVSALSETGGTQVTDLLMNIYLSGNQSSNLRDALARERDEVLARARSITRNRRAGIRWVNRAILLLGILGDRESVAQLSRFTRSQEFRRNAVKSLANIGDEPSMLHLAQRLHLSPTELLPSRTRDFQKHLSVSIASLGDRGAGFYVQQASRRVSDFGRHYVLAAGHCGSKKTLGPLRELLVRDDLKVSVVSSIGLIGGDSSVTLLRQLSSTADPDVRREAKRALERLGGKRPPRRSRSCVHAAPALPEGDRRDYDVEAIGWLRQIGLRRRL